MTRDKELEALQRKVGELEAMIQMCIARMSHPIWIIPAKPDPDLQMDIGL